VPTVAERLSISQHTVRNHLKNIFRRFGVRSQLELLTALTSAVE
jgi:DNA-binding CsgD family transcriptional regulator